MAMARLTSPGMGVPLEASRPSRPMGNQHRKSDMATVRSRRALVRSWDCMFGCDGDEDKVLTEMD